MDAGTAGTATDQSRYSVRHLPSTMRLSSAEIYWHLFQLRMRSDMLKHIVLSKYNGYSLSLLVCLLSPGYLCCLTLSAEQRSILEEYLASTIQMLQQAICNTRVFPSCQLNAPFSCSSFTGRLCLRTLNPSIFSLQPFLLLRTEPYGKGN